jgi:hypothetical protein
VVPLLIFVGANKLDDASRKAQLGDFIQQARVASGVKGFFDIQENHSHMHTDI